MFFTILLAVSTFLYYAISPKLFQLTLAKI